MALRIVALLVISGFLPSHACTVWEFGAGGLASGLNLVYLLYPIFDATNGSFYLDNRKNPYSCSETDGWQNGWHDFFTAPGIINWKDEEDSALGPVCRRLADGKEVAALVESVGVTHAELQTESALKLWNLQPWIQSRVDAAISQMMHLPRPTIGFHVRGGDKFDEDKIEKRKQTMPADYGGTCVLLGDNTKLVNELKELAIKELDCKPYIPHSYHKKEGHFQPDFISMPLNARCDATVQVLTDIELLAHTDYFVGSYNSGMVGLIEILRFALYGKSRFSFADASEHHRDWSAGIRNYIQSHPDME
eukprot:jgi/Botrbrau1/19320/Bobra.0073s0052.1